jgi:hypothetical protein
MKCTQKESVGIHKIEYYHNVYTLSYLQYENNEQGARSIRLDPLFYNSVEIIYCATANMYL